MLCPWNNDNMELSPEQQQAYDKFTNHENVFLTGPGGTGKSMLVRKMYSFCKEAGREVSVCALTGCAAVLLRCHAKTIHSWSGVARCQGENHKIIERVVDNKVKRQRWNDTQVLIIDEVSMMSKKMFEVLNNLARLVRKDGRPFGGMQVVFLGDFYQLPPVGDKDEPDTSAFCFESDAWFELFPLENNIQLKKIFRQEDEKYAAALNQIREGRIKQSSYDLLMGQVGKNVPDDCPIRPTKLFPVRAGVDAINRQELSRIASPEMNFSVCRLHEVVPTKKKYREQEIDYEFKYLETSFPGEAMLTLKKGAQVMCIINIEDMGLYNGSQGRVVDFTAAGIPLVKFTGIPFPLEVKPHTWVSEAVPHIGISQLPLVLCWALTIHKSQGATLDYAEVDVGSGVFESGQTYVALSRVKSIQGLFLKQFDYQRIYTSKKVKDFYAKLPGTSNPKSKTKSNSKSKTKLNSKPDPASATATTTKTSMSETSVERDGVISEK